MASLATIRPTDIVEIDKKGRRFHAVVKGKASRELTITPIDSRINYYTATSREVVNHWRKTKNSRKVTAPKAVTGHDAD